MSKQLMDGLRMVGMAAQEIIFENPLKHEAIAHGNAAFIDKFDPVAYHISEKIQQE